MKSMNMTKQWRSLARVVLAAATVGVGVGQASGAVGLWGGGVGATGGWEVVLQAAPAGTGAGTAAEGKAVLSQGELEQLLAPIALFPDSLLTQMLMASTYPLEVVQADRFVKDNKGLSGDRLTAELEKKDWDPSVKSLVNFPEQLAAMSEKIDLTMKIGDAFLAQQSDVLNTIQVLRNKANAAGNLKTTEQQVVNVAPAEVNVVQSPAQVTVVQAPPQVITIQSPSPTVVYVPTYNPVVVYGVWGYPAFPPAYWYPPAYYAARPAFAFGAGVAVGAAWGYAWGNCNWGRNEINIDVNRNTTINNNINRSNYTNVSNRNTNIQGGNTWQHNPANRKGAPYRDAGTAAKYGGENRSAGAIQSREEFRGRADAGRQDLSRGESGSALGGGARNPGAAGGGAAGQAGGGVNRPGGAGAGGAGGAGDRVAPAQRPSGGAGAPAQRPAGGGGGGGGAFDGVQRGGSAARADSQRGQASRASAPAQRASPAPSRGGGGGGGGRR